MTGMLPLADAQERVIALAPELSTETVPVSKASGRYLAAPLLACRTQPPNDLSAMDGYAISGAGPWTLIGESRAGKPFARPISASQCIRISTGAHIPVGAESVLIQEDAKVEGGRVDSISGRPEVGRHIRRKGFDFAAGDTLLNAGIRLTAPQIALALGGGHGYLSVTCTPNIAIIDSGDELASDPTACREDQIPASNGSMIAAMLEPLVCDIIQVGPVPDDLEKLSAALKHAENADIVITTGGASVGDHDLVRPALEDWGATIDFWKVAIKPGKPLLVARRGKQVILGLPGNPVSSFVTCFLFALPLVRAALGDAKPLPKTVTLPIGQDMSAGGSRQEFVRGFWNGQNVEPIDSRDSSALRALSSSNCLINRPVNAEPVTAGALAQVYLLENGCNA